MRKQYQAALAVLAAFGGTAGAWADAPATPAPAPTAPVKIVPTFVDLKQMTLAGIAVFASPQSGEFPTLWGSFPQATDGADGLATGKYAYGLELYPPSFPKLNKFTYMACCEVADSQKVPLSLLTRTVPAAKYADFAVPGGIKGLGDTFHYIYAEWLPNSAYQQAYPYDFERYDVSNDNVKPDEMPVEILVPVKDKK